MVIKMDIILFLRGYCIEELLMLFILWSLVIISHINDEFLKIESKKS